MEGRGDEGGGVGLQVGCQGCVGGLVLLGCVEEVVSGIVIGEVMGYAGEAGEGLGGVRGVEAGEVAWICG